MKVSELIKELQEQYDQDADIVADIWTADDIRAAAEHLNDMTDEQCSVVINYLYKNPNTEYGINNERIVIIVDNLIKYGDLDYKFYDN